MRKTRAVLAVSAITVGALLVGPSPATAATNAAGGSVGLPAGTSLSAYSGPTTITKAGTVIDRKDIVGRLVIKAPNVRITRSRIRGTAPSDTVGVITVKPEAKNFLIEDSLVTRLSASVKLDGIQGSAFTARRVEVSGGVDNIKIFGNNVTVEDSYLHATDYFSYDPNQRGATHNDNIQVLGGANITIRGNRMIQARTYNSSLQVTQDYAPLTRFTFAKNYVDGGGCSLNLNQKGKASWLTTTLSGNRLGRNTRYAACGLLTTRKVTVHNVDNRFSDGELIRQRYM